MNDIRNNQIGGIIDLLDGMDTVTDKVAAFSAMLERSLESGEELRMHSFGISEILDEQCRSLREIENELRSKINAFAKGKLAINNISEVARAAGLPIHKAELCLFLATGISFREAGKLQLDGANA
ncbi:hypothetical protein C8J30_11388 [Rhodobacter viridis]|uniref:Uncharacterized protein n=1 Tax=Rhodobacter viridis TaxID=1054202 RepID=A0A318U8B3_9RHOB|nr:hypothetical protein [Rhodobacter viridis]PYF08229.1 hypothetical protein C8J30_11388 [Rhodobacter viridis]